MKRKILIVLVRILGVLLSLLMLFILDYLVNATQSEDPVLRKAQISIKEEYNSYGLPLDQEPSKTVFYEDEKYVFYTDRILKKPKYSRKNIETGKEILLSLSKMIPQDMGGYIVPIPGRMVWEDGYSEEVGNYRTFLLELQSVIPENMQLLDVLPILKEHSEEYLFFRTDDSWTARGAYYGSKLIIESMGLSNISLEEYEEHMYHGYEGIDKIDAMKDYRLGQEVIEELEGIPEDRIFYYLPSGSKNRAIRQKKWNGSIITEKIKMVSKSRVGKAAFIGDSYMTAVAEGEGKSEEKKNKTALLLCDSSGQIIVPFLTTYYEKVYVVNIANYEYDQNQFKSIFREYDVSDVILVQKAENIGVLSGNKLFTKTLNLVNLE